MQKADKPIVLSRQVRVDDISAYYGVLIDALKRHGVAEEQADELLVDHLFATCTQCDMPVSGLDISRAARSGNAVDPDFPKVQRLKQGYCARKSCESFFYKLHFRECPGVNWEEVWQMVEQTELPRPEVEETGKASTLAKLIEQAGTRNLAVLGVALVILALVLYFQFRTPAYSTKPSGYKVDSSTVIYQVDPATSGY